MKNCFSDLGKSRQINNTKICPFSCCSCYIIDCYYCCCHCSCHLNKKRNIPKTETYSFVSTNNEPFKKTTSCKNNAIKQNKIFNINKNNNNTNSNQNSNKKINGNKFNYLKDNNKISNLININNDLIEQTKDLKNEINSLKEKLKKEKQNLSKVLKKDYDEISNGIKIKNNINTDKKDSNINYNKINFNNENIYKENKKSLKRIYIPKHMDNLIKPNNNNNRNLLTNNIKDKKKINQKQCYINTNFDDINNYNDINENKNINMLHNRAKINLKHKLLFHKSPTINIYEKYKNIKLQYYPINTQLSYPNSRNKLLSNKYNIKRVHEHIHLNTKNNENLKPLYQFETFHPQKRNYEYNSFLTDISINRTQNQSRPIIENFNKIDKIPKFKRPICFNQSNPDRRHFKARSHLSTSYEKKNRTNKIYISPFHRNIPNFLSYKNLDNIGKLSSSKKYNNNYEIKHLEVKRNPFLTNKKYKNNENLDKFKDIYNLSKSNSNYNLLKKNTEINRIQTERNKSSNISKQNLNFMKINPKAIKSLKYSKNINSDKILQLNNNLKKNNIHNKKIVKRVQISPNMNQNNKNYLTYKDNDINSNKNYKGVIPVRKNNNNHLSYTKNRENINIYQKYDLLKNKNDLFKLNDNNIKDDDTKYNTEINYENIKSEENKPITSFNDNFNKDKKISFLSKMNINTNLSIDDEINNNSKLNLNINIEISSKTIFTIYNISNKIYILCFDLINKKFSLRDFADFGKFEENYKLSLNSQNKGGNLLLSKGPYIYIITGKNYDLLYVYDSIKNSMNKLCNLNNNHSNGTLINYNNDNLLCISGDYNKKVELFSIDKNEWKNHLSETLIERSNCAHCILKQRYIFLIFGKNYPMNEYLNTIEYYDLYNFNKGWKYLNYKNKNSLIKMNICYGNAINFNDKKIIIFGGYNGFEKKDENNFYQIILDDNFEENNNNIMEETDRKLKDIDKNKKYYFNGGEIILKENENENNYNKILYFLGFDNQLNCHAIQISNLAHDVFYHFRK